MGLKQEVESSVGEQSIRLSTKPLSKRLPLFEAGISCFHLPAFRELALRTGTVILSVTGLAGMNPPDFNPLNLSSRTAFAQAFTPAESPAELDVAQLINDAVTAWNTRMIEDKTLGEDFQLTGTGTQLTGVFSDEHGDSVLFPSMLVTRNDNGEIGVRPLLTEIEGKGIDPSMNPPFLGDAAPKNGVFTVDPSPKVIEMTAALGRVLGLPDLQITGADRFGAGGYNSYRIGDATGDKLGLIEYQDGFIRMAQFGHSAIQAGIVPEYFMLQPEELATGGGGGETPPSQEVNRAGLKLEYKSTGGQYTVKNTPDANYGFKPPSQEGANAIDAKLTFLGKTLSIVPNKNLTTAEYGDPVIFNKDPMSPGATKIFIIMHPTVNPDDPNNIQLQYNKVAPDGIKIDPEYLKEQNQPNILHATLGATVTISIFGADIWDIKDPKIQTEWKQLQGSINNLPSAIELVVGN